MSIPSLPTDNLYKFLALAGLALLLFSFWYTDVKTSELSFKIAEGKGEMAVLKVYIDELPKEINSTEVVTKPKSVNDENSKELSKQRHEYLIKDAQLKAKVEILTVLLEDIEFHHKVFAVGAFIGGFMSYFGFLLWYRRVQKPNDMLLLNQLESLKSSDKLQRGISGSDTIDPFIDGSH